MERRPGERMWGKGIGRDEGDTDDGRVWKERLGRGTEEGERIGVNNDSRQMNVYENCE